MSSAVPAGPGQPAYATDPAPAQLPTLLRQLAADLADPVVTYLLGGHFYERTNHPRTRHFPAVFALRQGQVSNVEVEPDFVAFDTELLRYPEHGRAALSRAVGRPLSGYGAPRAAVPALPLGAPARYAASGRSELRARNRHLLQRSRA